MTSVQSLYLEGGAVEQMAGREVSALCTAVITDWESSYKEHYWNHELYANRGCGLHNYTV